MSELKEVAGIFAGILAVCTIGVGGFVLVGRGIGHNVEVTQCAAFATASGRETKFVDYTFWTWDYLTPTSDGKWISTTMLRDVDL